MMIVPYKPDHLLALNLQPEQENVGAIIDQSYANSLDTEVSFTAIDGDKIIACGGLVEMWENRGLAWMVLSDIAKNYMLQLTRAIMRYLRVAKYRRIETAVRSNFLEGHRWADLLGFKYEGTMRGYGISGDDYDLYARVK